MTRFLDLVLGRWPLLELALEDSLDYQARLEALVCRANGVTFDATSGRHIVAAAPDLRLTAASAASLIRLNDRLAIAG